MDQNELERRVLRRARQAMDPPAHAAEVARAALSAHLAHASHLPPASSGLQLAGGTATGLAAALLGAGFVAGWLARPLAPLGNGPAVGAAVPALSATRIEGPAAVTPDPLAPLPGARLPPDLARRPATAVSARSEASPSAPPAGVADTTESASTLLEEARLLQQAEQAIRRDDAAAALYVLGELDRVVPRGKLDPERQAARVLASCLWEKSAVARAAARSYLAKHRSSAFADRIQEACAIDAEQ